MKKVLLLFAFIAAAFVQTGVAQQNPTAADTSAVLASYYGVKDALVAGNASSAALKAVEMVKVLKNADVSTVSKAKKDSLIIHADIISKSKDLKAQREHFSDLSTGMIALAKVVKLSAEPIYELHCPMKKSNWLSTEKAVKNPYYGNAMLTCGAVVETIK